VPIDAAVDCYVRWCVSIQNEQWRINTEAFEATYLSTPESQGPFVQFVQS